MAIQKIIRSVATAIFCGLLASCTTRTRQIPVAPNLKLRLFESRIDGAGPAPDSIKIYITNFGEYPRKTDIPIFEGQEVGRVCYVWLSKYELHIRISGGYPDNVLGQWQDKAGHIVKIVFDGFKDCKWNE